MIETLSKEINGANYTVTQFTARRAIRLQAKLLKLIGPFLFEIGNDASKAVSLLAAAVTEDNLESTVCEVLACTRKSGMELTPSVIDMEFAGDLGTLYQVVRFALEANYENFLLALGIGKNQETKIPEPMHGTKKNYTRI